MNAFSMLVHNGKVIKKAEKVLNDAICDTDNHCCYLYIVNPDGTRIRLQKGFKIESAEFAIVWQPR